MRSMWAIEECPLDLGPAKPRADPLSAQLIPCLLHSADSVALGSAQGRGYQGSFSVHELALDADGAIHLLTTQRVKIA
jgi:hypothetical protein